MSDDNDIRSAWSASSGYVTRAEMAASLEKLEQNIDVKIDCSAQRQRNWVLGGCLAVIIAFGGGYASLVSKLDRLSDELPALVNVQEGRRAWNLYQDQRLDRQDQEIRKISPGYGPMPYRQPPQ